MKKFEAKAEGSKVVTGTVRASYAHVFEPKAIDEKSTPKYSVSLLIDKNDTSTVEAIETAVRNAIELGKAKLNIKDTSKLPARFKTPLRDGDVERPDDDNYAGMYFINCSSTTAPQIIDLKGIRITEPEGFYSGCFCRASVNMYAFNTSGNSGIAAGLQNLQFVDEGDRLAGGASAANDFGVEEVDLSA